MIFFTSDLHIGHNKDFIWGARGFKSIEEHDKEILKRWNSIIEPADTVFILGDLCLGDGIEWNSILCNLNGFKKFIIGNHDTKNKIELYSTWYNMENLGYANIYKYSKKWKFYLSHYPTFVFSSNDTKHVPIINLYGHTHQKDLFYNNNPYMYNVGLDSHDCYPVSIDQIIKDIKEAKDRL